MKAIVICMVVLSLLGFSYPAKAPTGHLVDNSKVKRYLFIKCMSGKTKDLSFSDKVKNCTLSADYRSKEWKPL